MADSEHQAMFEAGPEVWNRWRNENPGVEPILAGLTLSGDLRKYNLFRTDFCGCLLYHVDLSETDLRQSKFHSTTMKGASFEGADLSFTTFERSDLCRDGMLGTLVNFSHATLTKAIFWAANASGALFRGADLTGTNLVLTNLVEADLTGATLVDCDVYGAAMWGLKTEGCKQERLRITSWNEPEVWVDDIEVAQFVHLLLTREKLRNVIRTITSKAVLVLGRFTPDRKVILDAIAKELRQHGLLPFLFDFERATSRDFTETIQILAGMSLFVIADITNPKSAPLELQATVPDYQIPFVPIIQQGEQPFSMFRDLKGKYDWVLDPVSYGSADQLLKAFDRAILQRAWEKHRELQQKKTTEIQVISVEAFLDEGQGTLGSSLHTQAATAGS